jgi:hypothetical protein
MFDTFITEVTLLRFCLLFFMFALTGKALISRVSLSVAPSSFFFCCFNFRAQTVFIINSFSFLGNSGFGTTLLYHIQKHNNYFPCSDTSDRHYM